LHAIEGVGGSRSALRATIGEDIGGNSRVRVDSLEDRTWPTKQKRARLGRVVYIPMKAELRGAPGSICFFVGGGGDQGESGEVSSHPKPSEEIFDLVNPNLTDWVTSPTMMHSAMNLDDDKETVSSRGKVMKVGRPGAEISREERDSWVVELYKGRDEVKEEQDLQVLLSDMLGAWGIQKLVGAERIGDYIFKLQFAAEDDKERVVDGGPWRHKGDAFIVVHYDGLV
jgi:hypothetical protein